MIDADSIHVYLDGDLDEAKKRELAQWLLAAPENRALFHREVALAAILDERAATSRSRAMSAPQSPSPSASSSSSTRTHTNKHRSKSLRLHRPRRARAVGWPVFAAVAAVVAITAVLVLQPSAATPAAQSILIGETRGSVSVVRGNVTLATLPPALLAGDQVRIGPNASARLEMDHGRTRIWGAPDTTVVIASIREARDRVGTRLDLAHGNLLIEAAPQPANAPLRIRSPRSEAEVVGTVLSFTAFADRDRLLVGHGVVAYSRSSGEQRTQILAGGFGDSDGARLTVGRLDFQPPAAVTTARVNGFSLIDDSTGKSIPGYTQLANGSVIDLAGLQGRKINISADVLWPDADHHGHIVFHYDDAKPIAESGAPYSVLSDVPSLSPATQPERFHNGIHALVATPYSGKIDNRQSAVRTTGGNGSPGQSATLIFTVINAAP
jgi:FecR protein